MGSNPFHEPRITAFPMKNALNPFLRGAQLLFAVLLIVFATARLLLLTLWRDNPEMELFLCRRLLICDTDRLREESSRRNWRKESLRKLLPRFLTFRKPCGAIPLPRIAGVNLARPCSKAVSQIRRRQP